MKIKEIIIKGTIKLIFDLIYWGLFIALFYDEIIKMLNQITK